MNNLLKVLNDMNDSESSIEFSKDFTLFQSAFNYINDHIRPLNKIQFRGGNENYILDLLSRLLRILRQQKYLDNDNKPVAQYKNQLRKITFFLLLNTEVSFPYDLKRDNDICQLLNAIPKLTPCLLLSCIWGLSLQNSFYEIIEHSPNWFVLQFLEATSESLKHLKPYEIIEAVKNITVGIYMNIARSDYQVREVADKKIMLTKLFDVVLGLMRHFFTPDAEKFEDWKKTQFYKYMGYVIMYVCDMLLTCLEVFEKKASFVVGGEFQIFHLMKNEHKMVDNHSNGYSDVVQDHLLMINNVLLSTLHTNVTNVTLDIYLDWVEIDVDNETTLQRAVGERIYRIIEKINMNSLFDNEVVTILQNLAIKPQTLQDKLKEATIGDIITKFEVLDRADSTRSLWMTEFVMRGDLVTNNSECLDTILANFDALTYDSIEILMKSFEDENFDELDKLKSIILNAFDCRSHDEQLELISFMINNFGVDVDLLATDAFQMQLIEFFNKSVDEKLDLKIVLQNPKLFYEKVFEYAISTKRLQSILIDILKVTKQISENYIESNITAIYDEQFEQLTDSQHATVPKFIADLYTANIIEPKLFINQIIYTKIMTVFSPFNEMKMLSLISTLNHMARNCPHFADLSPPLLIITGNVLEKARWDLVRYSETLGNIVRTAIEFIQTVTKAFIVAATPEDRQWILKKIEGFRSVNEFYFQRFSLAKEDRVLEFDEYLFLGKIEDAHSQDVIRFLCENLVRCTFKETEWLARNPTLFASFPKAITLISTIVSRTSETNSLTCMRQIVVNYMKIIKSKSTVAVPTTPEEDLALFTSATTILSKLPNTLYDDLFLYSHQLMFDIISINLGDIKSKIIDLIVSMKECEGRDFLLAKIQD